MFLTIVGIVLIVFIVTYIRKYIPVIKSHIIMRIILICGSGFMLYGYSNYPTTFMNDLFIKGGVDIRAWNQAANYKANGFIIGFLSNLDTTVIKEPEEYSKENMQQIAKDIEKQYSGKVKAQKSRKAEHYIYYE